MNSLQLIVYNKPKKKASVRQKKDRISYNLVDNVSKGEYNNDT